MGEDSRFSIFYEEDNAVEASDMKESHSILMQKLIQNKITTHMYVSDLLELNRHNSHEREL